MQLKDGNTPMMDIVNLSQLDTEEVGFFMIKLPKIIFFIHRLLSMSSILGGIRSKQCTGKMEIHQ